MAQKDQSFEVTVKRSPVEPPLIKTKEATSIEIRDQDGVLVSLLIFIPGKPVFFASSADKDVDFEAFVRNMGFKINN